MEYTAGDQVKHKSFGIGTVKYDDGETAGIRFEHGLEECAKTDIEPIISISDAIARYELASPLEVIAKIQAEAIQSVNDTWGVFSLSRIDLLPHQLWVCKRVTEKIPARWLVADDVGLGKTIEAGLILWPLLSRKIVQRLLVICPASLVEQWQLRLRTMFDIRLSIYAAETDTRKSDFWNTHPWVVASVHTLRMDSKGRHERMLESEPWDLVIVDEAHHLNNDEHSGQTLGYKLIDRLQKKSRIRSMIFFTGTPHRGKDFGFLSLLHLLRPDIFSPDKSLDEQLACLNQVMIRNNKQNVTDLKGEKIFFPPKVRSETYTYSPEEAEFYRMMSEFILTGKAYASNRSTQESKTIILVLITMQKLASSSVAAIRRALINRRENLKQNRKKAEKDNREKIIRLYRESQRGDETLDNMAGLEEKIAESAESHIRLIRNEEEKLDELIEYANRIREETKIQKITELVEKDYAEESVLFFTEYKATQSLLISALMKRFGNDCVCFINGDHCASGVINREGKTVTLRESRESASERFNEGKVRFLVSTEAAGEGIDLQESCHTLIHVDLPWNPMRMHQRVGRLNRYGQKKAVEVISLRNPDTVESMIWEKLDSKIQNIMKAFGSVMDEPEDLMQLVLGMTDQTVFNELYSQAKEIPKEKLGEWFDRKTASFAGKNVIDTVKAIVGNCDRFDYQETAADIPQMDLQDIRPFFISMLKMNSRRVKEEDSELEFLTPEKWRDEPGILPQYKNVVFNRKSGKKDKHIMGVGHKIINKAIEQAKHFTGTIAFVPKSFTDQVITVFKISDRLTDSNIKIRKKVAAAGFSIKEEKVLLIKDSELLALLNKAPLKFKEIRPSVSGEEVSQLIRKSEQFIMENLKNLDLPFTFPNAELLAVIWPEIGIPTPTPPDPPG